MKDDVKTSAKTQSKPVVSNKLPKAFSQPNRLHKKRDQNTDLAEAQEFKQTHKLLSPIKMGSPQRAKIKKSLRQPDQFPFLDKKQKKLLEPFLKMQLPSRVDFILLPVCKVKLEEVITISVLHSSYRSGCVRKIIHGPSLMLYVVKEVPVATREVRQSLIEWLSRWQKLQKRHQGLANVNSTFWNSPEGCVSIVMEYCAGGSLAQLADSVGGLPEGVLSHISLQLLNALNLLHHKGSTHGGLTPSQVLFTKDCKVKLSLGISSRKATMRDPMPLYEKAKRNGSACDDVFDFGLLLLGAYLGTFDFFEEAKNLQDDCCIFHGLRGVAEYPQLKRISSELAELLCACTKYNPGQRKTVSQLMKSRWFCMEQYRGPAVALDELLALANNWNRVVPSECLDAAQGQLERVCRALSVILPSCAERPQPELSRVRELASDLGLEVPAVISRLQLVV